MADPLFKGDWSLVSSKSKFSIAGWNPAHETRLYEEVRGGYKLTVKGTNQATPYQWGYTALYDGKDHPVYGRTDVDAIEAYRVNDRITIGFFKKGGVEVAAYKRNVLSEKNLQVIASGLDESGAAYFDVVEYTA